jgi:hypothetical protein
LDMPHTMWHGAEGKTGSNVGPRLDGRPIDSILIL